VRSISGTLLALGLCIAAPSLRASISFGTGATNTPGSIGNSLVFSGTGLNVTAYAFSTTHNSNTTLDQAAVGWWSPGLGVCNTNEFVGTCLTSGPPEHAIGNELDTGVTPNVQNFDFILLQFSVPLTSVSLTLDPFGTHDMDATYFAGNCASTLGCTPANFLTNIINKADTQAGLQAITGGTLITNPVIAGSFTGCGVSCSTQQTFSISGIPSSGVNWVLIGASTAANYGGDGNPDYFKLNAMNYSTVPEPATFGLAGAALAAIGLLRRKKRSAIV
jgi:hypothetical protein